MPREPSREFLLLARVRRSLRSLNNAIVRGAEAAGLTLQQQAFLLAIEAYGGSEVLFADVREELEMDRATASLLLRSLMRAGLVSRSRATDRRAFYVSMTKLGRQRFRESVTRIHAEIRGADHRDELGALGPDLDRYLAYYRPGRPRDRSTRPR